MNTETLTMDDPTPVEAVLVTRLAALPDFDPADFSPTDFSSE